MLDPPDGQFAGPPPFEELSSGLVSSAPEVLRFYCAMADGGAPVIGADSLALMTADALTEAQRRGAAPILGPGESWGMGTGVDVEAAAAVDGAGSLGLDRRDRDDGLRRPACAAPSASSSRSAR